MDYIERFEKMALGLFVHFGLYSIEGRGEWSMKLNGIPAAEYGKLAARFSVKKTWAKELVRTARAAGAKYVTLTTRHHDGFSLYDTRGLDDFDAPHSKCGRDLIEEFAGECKAAGITPFFYHTLLDWRRPEYERDFAAYIDYLVNSIEILCTRYGEVGGFWFDGMWDKPDADWQENRLYGTIRKYQPNAMIINNTGLSELGKVGHPEIDSVTFERGKPCAVDNSDRRRAGEMCQILNDHWGYAANDCNYKGVGELIDNLVDCRRCGCNFLLNTGLKGDGSVNLPDKGLLNMLGKWIKANKGFVYGAGKADVTADNAAVLYDGRYYYFVVNDIPVSADEHVILDGKLKKVAINSDKVFKKGVYLDDGVKTAIVNNGFSVRPFSYGNSLYARVIKVKA